MGRPASSSTTRWRWLPRSTDWTGSLRRLAAHGSPSTATSTQSPSRTSRSTARLSNGARRSSLVSERSQSVLDGSTFVVGDRRGDVAAEGGREHGFFSDDTRFVSHWVLTVGEEPLELLGLDQGAHFATQFFLSPKVAPDEEVPWSVIRRRVIDHVWMEEVTITSHLHVASMVQVTLAVDSDFADLFEVKDATGRKRDVAFQVNGDSLTLSYRRGSFGRGVGIAVSRPAAITRHGF